MRKFHDPEDFEPTDIIECVRWSREYAKSIGEDNLLRWSIGLYQLRHLLETEREYDSAEAAGAFFIHAVGAAESVGAWVHLDQGLPLGFSPMLAVTRVTQNHVYISREKARKLGNIRSSRINLPLLGQETAALVHYAWSFVLPSQRADGFERASGKLVHLEWRR